MIKKLISPALVLTGLPDDCGPKLRRLRTPGSWRDPAAYSNHFLPVFQQESPSVATMVALQGRGTHLTVTSRALLERSVLAGFLSAAPWRTLLPFLKSRVLPPSLHQARKPECR